MRSRGRRKLLGSQPRTFPQLPTTAFGVVLPVDDRTRRWPPEHAYPQFHSRRRDGTEACVHVVRSRACPWLLHARSEEHTSELQSLMRISYAGVCLETKKIL